jgi:integral membrane protein (TIGR01906 family)
MKNTRVAFYLAMAILVPVALIFLGVRILLSSAFLNLEYRMPGFPADNYGFTREERLKWSKLAVQYLLNDSNEEFLGDLTFLDGTPLYNDRELSHMLDVKKVVKPILRLGYTSWGLLIGIGLISYRINWRYEFRKGLRLGGTVMLALLGIIGIFAIVSFWNFFTFFHSIFFEGDSWLFLYSDTLIRLFPLRFWQDAFLLAGIIILGSSMGLMVGFKPEHKISV